MFHDYAPVFIIGMLNSFAEKTENGIIDFDTYVTDPGEVRWVPHLR